MESNLTAGPVVRALGALAQEHRLAAFRLLVQAGAEGLPAGELSARLGVPPSSLSFHLAQLAHAGLVSQQRRSRSIIYRAELAAMSALVGYLTENCCGGADCGVAIPDCGLPDCSTPAASDCDAA
ncbi:ArsR/SmtB family transcription factor [Novosphingobium huizhouense]|uniref:ArsR/SmtB family transcription factor n=1 Tax=Novosphingobium huizhouense TaxID=2866625 RepID=UPI001CD82F16|nr:metalloregulator ArsR/SmtB family transcription factor [Novosphingobium huizhouense]